MPCVGLTAKDAKGDNLTLDPAPAIPPSMDLTGIFFRYGQDKDGKPLLTANIQVNELTEEPYSDVASIEWEIQYTVDDFVYVAGAQVPPTGATKYYVGSWFLASSTAPAFYGLPAASTGRFVPGKDGVIEIVIPNVGDLAGKKLTNIWARTRLNYVFAAHHQGNGSAALDRAPDGDKFGAPYTVQACSEPPPEAPPADDKPAAPIEAPQPVQPQPQPEQQPQQQQQQSDKAAAAKKRKACQKKAKKKFKKNKKKRKKALKRCKKIK